MAAQRDRTGHTRQQLNRSTLLPQRTRLHSGNLDPHATPIPFNPPHSTGSFTPPANPFGARSPPRLSGFAAVSPHRSSAPGLSASGVGSGLRWTQDERTDEESASEWSMNGLAVPLLRLRHLLDEQETSDLATSGEMTPRPFSALSATTSLMAAYNFGGEPARWQLEVVRNGGLPRPPVADPSMHDPLLAPLAASNHRPGGLSLYLTCSSLDRDYPAAPGLEIPVSIMLGLRDKRARHNSTDAWLWRVWENFSFGPENDFWACHSMPEPAALIAEASRPVALDQLVLSLQIASTSSQSGAQYRDAHIVPRALMTGLESLFDDPGTGDVLITVLEMLETPTMTSEGSGDLAAPSDNQAPLYRRRIIYAHSAILKARGGYFDAMLGGGDWSETGESIAGRRRHRLTICDFSYETVAALVKWLYTNEIQFVDSEDARKMLHDELPEGVLGNGANAIGWNWQPLPAPGRRVVSEAEARSVFGRVSPISSTTGGRISPVQLRAPATQERRATGRSKAIEDDKAIPTSPPAKAVQEADPHPHPGPALGPTSALNIYRLAHRCELTPLATLALEHLVSTLTPRTAFPLLLATELWPELHLAVRAYALEHWSTILTTAKDEVQRSFTEIDQWENGGKTLFEFVELLSERQFGRGAAA